jgi:hypothetical protein
MMSKCGALGLHEYKPVFDSICVNANADPPHKEVAMSVRHYRSDGTHETLSQEAFTRGMKHFHKRHEKLSQEA